MKEGQVREQLSQASYQISECRVRVGHAHVWKKRRDDVSHGDGFTTRLRQTLEVRERAQSQASLLLPDSLRDSVDDLQCKPASVLDRPSIFVRSLVRQILYELVNEIPMCAMHLDTVEPSAVDGVRCSGYI